MIKNLLLTAICLNIVSLNTSNGQAGSLDQTFGIGGKVITHIGNVGDYGQAVAIQDDGKIVVAGSSTSNGFSVVRYNTNGSLDSTFGVNGIVSTLIGTNSSGYAVQIQDDGKILVGGNSYRDTTYNDFTLVRYNVNGSLDNTFDDDGIAFTPIIAGSYDEVRSIAIQPDGKIVLGGTSVNVNNPNFALARFNIDGSLDLSFDNDGIVISDVGGYSDNIHGLAIQNDGKIIAAGLSSSDLAMVRYNNNGSVDSTFDADGIVLTNLGAYEQATAITLQNDGKIVVAVARSGVNRDFHLIRYNIDGSIDPTFDTDGTVTTDLGSNSDDNPYAVAIQNDGKIILAGTSDNGINIDFALVRYNINGSLDGTFDTDGKVITSVADSNDFAKSIAIQSNGQIVVAGFTFNDSTNAFAVLRYNGDAVVNVNEHPVYHQLNIYPNPNSGDFTIQSDIRGDFDIINAIGQVVKRINLNSENRFKTSISDLKNGLYFICGHINESVASQKIVVTK
jgi:uncharacterized delta-60 repeat protein